MITANESSVADFFKHMCRTLIHNLLYSTEKAEKCHAYYQRGCYCLKV